MKIGDLVKLSLHGRMMTGVPNITDKIGIILCDDLLHDNLYFVKWLNTGVSSEVHKDFIEKLEKNT
jgi:ABC-type uncharacterized transport system YnjBCD ATPase subunit